MKKVEYLLMLVKAHDHNAIIKFAFGLLVITKMTIISTFLHFICKNP